MTPVFDVSGVQATGSGWDSFTPSPQQQRIQDWVLRESGNANVIAVAGSGKTTTLRWICRVLQGTVAFTAYNKKIADEIGFKLKQDGAGSNIQARTFHSFGMAAWNKVVGRTQVDGDKIENICEDLGIRDEQRGPIKRLVSLAKNHAFGVGGRALDSEDWDGLIDHFQLLPDDLDVSKEDTWRDQTISQSLAVLKASNALSGRIIDFDDMIYMPVLAEIPVYRNDWVLVDEAQDTNPARRMLAGMMLKSTGRMVWVGDPRQAIYGFTGASANALDVIAREYKCVDLPLTVTYRCPKRVVEHAQRWVSHIEAAPSAPEGELRVVSSGEFSKEHPSLNKDCAILCRLTKPLVQIAFELIRKKIPCHVEGRDIGRNLVTLTKRYKIDDARENFDQISAWGRNQISRLQSKKKDAEAQSLQDKLDTLEVIVDFLDPGATVFDLRSEITKLFDDTPEGQGSRNVTLSTVHKAKGREWPTVYLYGRTTFMPSRWAKQDWQKEQEDNLIYVAVTRAMRTLVEVDLNLEEPEEPVREELSSSYAGSADLDVSLSMNDSVEPFTKEEL